jgi:hypothetical protein
MFPKVIEPSLEHCGLCHSPDISPNILTSPDIVTFLGGCLLQTCYHSTAILLNNVMKHNILHDTKCDSEPLRLESSTSLYQNKISRPLLNMKIQEQQFAQKGANT